MDTAQKALLRFVEDGTLDKHLKGIDLPDVPLWAIWAIQEYAKDAGVEVARERYGALVKAMLEHIISGKHPNLQPFSMY